MLLVIFINYNPTVLCVFHNGVDGERTALIPKANMDSVYVGCPKPSLLRLRGHKIECWMIEAVHVLPQILSLFLVQTSHYKLSIYHNQVQ